MAALLALLLACASASLASVTAPSPAGGIAVVDDDLVEHEALVDARSSARDDLRRRSLPANAMPPDATARGVHAAPPRAATDFVPPQRKTLLRLLH